MKILPYARTVKANRRPLVKVVDNRLKKELFALRLIPRYIRCIEKQASMTIHTSEIDTYIRLGTSSFSETDWIGPFYPKGTKPAEFLSVYAEKFDTVEIDATYYAVPSKSTVEGWARKTPEDFLIAAKFPKTIVHGGDGPKPDPDVILMPDRTYEERDRFLEHISLLGPRLGPLLIQFPYLNKKVFAGRKLFFSRLNHFLSDLPTDFRYAVEIRNRHWLVPEFADILRQHNVSLVLVDQAWMPHGDEMMKMIDCLTSDFVYIRLLGDRNEIEKITQSWEKEVIDRGNSLERWADLLLDLVTRRIKTVVYVNNHYAGHAPATARRLLQLLKERGSK